MFHLQEPGTNYTLYYSVYAGYVYTTLSDSHLRKAQHSTGQDRTIEIIEKDNILNILNYTMMDF